MLSRSIRWGAILVLLLASMILPPTLGIEAGIEAGIEMGSEVAYAMPSQQNPSFNCGAVSEIPTAECDALVALYNTTNGASWINNSGWLADNTPCDWEGVRCSNGRVHQIFLNDNGLAGPLPPQLGDLTNLTWLQLDNNQLSGTIPPELGNLTQVTWLRLEFNQLSGSIPAALGNMTGLASLYLSDNQLTGSIPPELGNLPNLAKLNLSYLPISGQVPAALGNLSTLHTLSLNETQLTGALPATFTNLANLEFFHFLNTGLCEPADSGFQSWLSGIPALYSTGTTCSATGPATSQPATATPVVPIYTPTPSTQPPTTQPPANPGRANLCEGLITDRNNYPMSPLAKPALGQTVTDPEFGTTIRRITDIEATVTGEQAVIKPMYNTVQAWNADESYMILYQRSVGHQLFNGITYEYIRNLDIRPADLEEVFWHFSDPDILFYVEPYYVNANDPGQQLIRYRVSTDTREVVRSFGNVCAQNEGVTGGNDVQMMSWDSDVIGLRCVNEPARFFNYRISTDTISPVITSGQGNNYAPWYAPQPAPSGNLMLIDNVVIDNNLNPVRTLNMQGVEHSTLGQFANGNDGIFTVAFAEGPQGGCGPGALIAHDLTDGTCRTLVGQENGYPYPPSNTHMSALSHRNPGWVAVSMVGVTNNGAPASEAGQELLDNELLLVDTAPGGDVCRVGHHRSFARGAPRGYWGEPHVVISPTGTRLLFGSDWEGGSSVDSYVVELPSYQGSVPPVQPTPTPVQPTPTPVQPTPVQPTPTPMQPTATPIPNGTITGQVFDDANGNGNYDPGEPALANISVILIDVTTAGQTTTISTQTNDQGIYTFTNLSNVDYRISFILPPGYQPLGELSNQVTASGILSVDAPYRNLESLYLPVIVE